MAYVFTPGPGTVQSTKTGEVTRLAEDLPLEPLAGALLGSTFWFLLADRKRIVSANGVEVLTPTAASGGDILNILSFRNKLYAPAQGGAGGSLPSISVFDPVADKDAAYRMEHLPITGLPTESNLKSFVVMNRGFIVTVASTSAESQGAMSCYVVDTKGNAKVVVDSRIERVSLTMLLWPGAISSDCIVLTEHTAVTVSDDGSVSAIPQSFSADDCTRALSWTQARSSPSTSSSTTTTAAATCGSGGGPRLLHNGAEFAALSEEQQTKVQADDNMGASFWFQEATAEALEMCPICFCEFEEDDEGNTGAVTLDCGHGFHVDCLTQCISRAQDYLPKGQRIVFNMAKCPGGCGHLIRHPVFPESGLIVDRYQKVLLDVVDRAAIEYPSDKPATVMDKYLHYVCHTCQNPYWGGNKDCAAMMTEPTCDPSLLICNSCATDFSCPTHKRDFVVYKCAHCCRPANHFSFGHRRICEECISDAERQKSNQPCSGTRCGLPTDHPTENGSYAIGCLACLEAKDFDLSKVPEFVPAKKAE